MTDTVYYTCPFVPEELIEACGFHPRRLTPTSTGALLFQTEGMCSFTNAWLESLHTTANQNKSCIAIFTTSCDQMRRAFDLVYHQKNTHTFLLDVPSTTNDRSLGYYQDELRRLMHFLCEISGHQTDESHLPHYTQKTDVREADIDTQGSLQIAITGGPVPNTIQKAVEQILSTADARISLNLTENKLVPLRKNQTDQLSLEELACAYFKIPSIWKRSNDAFYEWITPQIQSEKIDGVMLFRHVFCDLWHSQIYEFKKRISVPLLDVELDGKEVLSAAAISRLQAFLETLA